MKYFAFLRGVMPTGSNRIPKMSDVAKCLSKAGFQEVSTYLQSGNILLESSLNPIEIKKKIHQIILREIGADLAVILKRKEDLAQAIEGNPFDQAYDLSRIHLTFTNDCWTAEAMEVLKDYPLKGEIFYEGKACCYLYLPRDAEKKRLNTNLLEKKLGITATTRKLSVIQRLHDMI